MREPFDKSYYKEGSYMTLDDRVKFTTRIPSTYGRVVQTLIDIGLYESRAEYMRSLISEDMRKRHDDNYRVEEMTEDTEKDVEAFARVINGLSKSQKELMGKMLLDESIPETASVQVIGAKEEPRMEPEKIIPRGNAPDEKKGTSIKMFKDE